MSFIDFGHMTPFHEAYTASIGRALVICQHLEDCAHHVMVVWAITDELQMGKTDLQELRHVALSLRRVSLGGSVRRLEAAEDFGAERAHAIEVGRQARNWLVHEAGDVVAVDFGPATLADRLEQFRAEVRSLCAANRVLAAASFAIAERRSVSSRAAKEYATRLERWILAPVSAILDSGDAEREAG